VDDERRIADEGLDAVTLQADSHAALDLIARAEDIFSGDANQSVAEEFELRKRFVEGYHYLRERDPLRLAILEAGIMSSVWARRSRLAGQTGMSGPRWILLPLAILGAIPNYATYRLIGALTNRLSNENEMRATMKFVGALMLLPLTWIAIAAAVWWRFGVLAAVVTLIALPILGYVALRVFESLAAWRARPRENFAAQREAKAKGSKTLAICNVVGSMITRESSGTIYTHAGPEIAVASTKAFLAQVVGLKLLALYLAQVRGVMWPQDRRRIVEDLHKLPAMIAQVLKLRPQVRELAEHIANSPTVLFMGRHVGYPVALEGALKLKEISYLHAEGLAAGEMKHGPIALVEDGVPVVAVATQCHVYQKVLSNIQEVKARGAYVIAICSVGDGEEVARHADRVLEVPRIHELLVPALVAVPLQLLAYEVATIRGRDVDQPRNLAKSVTVE